jgi:hypothetical protein
MIRTSTDSLPLAPSQSESLDTEKYAQTPTSELITLFQQQCSPHTCSSDPQRTREGIWAEFRNRLPRKSAEERTYRFFKIFSKNAAFNAKECADPRITHENEAKRILDLGKKKLHAISLLHSEKSSSLNTILENEILDFENLEALTNKIFNLPNFKKHMVTEVDSTLENSKLHFLRLKLIEKLEKILETSCEDSTKDPITTISHLFKENKTLIPSSEDKNEFIRKFIDLCGNSNNLTDLAYAAANLAKPEDFNEIIELYKKFITASTEILAPDEIKEVENCLEYLLIAECKKALDTEITESSNSATLYNLLESHRTKKTHRLRSIGFTALVIACIVTTFFTGGIGAITFILPILLYFPLFHTNETYRTERIEATKGIISGDKQYYKKFFKSVHKNLGEQTHFKQSEAKEDPAVTRFFSQLKSTVDIEPCQVAPTFKELKDRYNNFINSFEMLLSKGALTESVIDDLICNERFIEDLFSDRARLESLIDKSKPLSKAHQYFIDKACEGIPF